MLSQKEKKNQLKNLDNSIHSRFLTLILTISSVYIPLFGFNYFLVADALRKDKLEEILKTYVLDNFNNKTVQ